MGIRKGWKVERGTDTVLMVRNIPDKAPDLHVQAGPIPGLYP